MMKKSDPSKHKKLPLWLRSLLFLVVFALLAQLISIIITNPYVSEAYVIEQMIEDHESFDIVILGSSHNYCAFDPAILNAVLADTNVYNLSIPNLSFGQIALVLQQMIEDGKTPNVVVLDMYSLKEKVDSHTQIAFFNAYTKTWQPEYLKTILGYYEPEQWLYPLFPLIYQHETWKLPTMLNNNLIHFWNKESLTEEQVRHNIGYSNAGFRPISIIIDNEDFQSALANPVEIKVTTNNLTGFEEVLALSQQHDIQLVFVTAPYPNGLNADHEFLQELSQRYGITIHNFNELGTDQFRQIQFMDAGHMNALGGVEGSLLLAEAIAAETTRELRDEKVTLFQQLNLQEIKIEKNNSEVTVTLIPEDPTAQWDVEWYLVDGNNKILREKGGTSMSFTIPTSLMQYSGLSLQLKYGLIGSEYTVPLKVALIELLDINNDSP